MLKIIFSILGLAIALAVVSSLLKTQLGQFTQMGQTKTRAAVPSGSEAAGTAGRMDGRAVGRARLDGFAATGAAEVPSAAQQADTNKSMFERTDQAWQQSEQRYRRADP